MNLFHLTGKEVIAPAQYQTVMPDGKVLINGLPRGSDAGEGDFKSVGQIVGFFSLDKKKYVERTGPLDPISFFIWMESANIRVWSKSSPITDTDGSVTTVYYSTQREGRDLLIPGASPTFAGVRATKLSGKLNFISLMLALFAGTASLPHILIRYYTVKDQASARKSTVVGIASIGFFYILTLYLGLAAMTSGVLDPTNSNMLTIVG